MSTWDSDTPPPPPPAHYSLRDWARILRRGLAVGTVTFGCLGLLLLVRLIERPLCGAKRPVTPWITQFVCRAAFVLMGMERRVEGAPMTHKGAIVANHSSWLDIFTLNASKRIYFVSKAEVAKWPGIGWLARATGTVFIERRASQAQKQKAVFEERLAAGHKLLFFPEGTSTDGRRVLPFKTALFAAFFSSDVQDLWIQPVSVIYEAPDGREPRFYGWWGDMDLAPHLIATLAAKPQGRVTVRYHDPLPVTGETDRKRFAKTLEDAVRLGLKEAGALDA